MLQYSKAAVLEVEVMMVARVEHEHDLHRLGEVPSGIPIQHLHRARHRPPRPNLNHLYHREDL